MWLHGVLLFCFYSHAYTSSFGHVSRLSVEKVVYYETEAKQIYNEFLKKYRKAYDKETFKHKFRIFKDNLNRINKLNENSELTTYGITTFCDISKDEFILSASCFSVNHADLLGTNIVHFNSTRSAPSNLDWRKKYKVTPVKAEGRCKSCFIISAVGAIEAKYAIQHKQLISLSEQQVINCISVDCPCFGGWIPSVFRYVNKIGGIESEVDYPYRSSRNTCKYDSKKFIAKVTGYKLLRFKHEEDMTHALNEYGPLSIALSIDWTFMSYCSGIYDGKCTSTGSHLNRAALLVGYGTENRIPYWIIKHSFGTNWGENGYMRLIRGKGKCGIGSFVWAVFVE